MAQLDTIRSTPASLRHLTLLAVLATLGACGDVSSDESSADAESSIATTGDGDGDGDQPTGDGDPLTGDGDGEPGGTGPGDECPLDCGLGDCVEIEFEFYCECPEGTQWGAYGCDPCPAIDAADAALELRYVDVSGSFLLAGAPPPANEYDDANIWLENARTGDRVFVGNTHDLAFSIRVTPGLYEIIYEVESAGAQMPHNSRVEIERVALFTARVHDIDVPVARVSGQFLLDGDPPPAIEYDDANIWLRDPRSGGEVRAGNTSDGAYEVRVVPGSYEVVYRLESAGEAMPRNVGAVLDFTTFAEGDAVYDVGIESVSVQGEFRINGMPAPEDEYNDANIVLESDLAGTVALGNTHDGTYDVRVIPAQYTVVYMHETGAAVPQNQRARLEDVDLSLAPLPLIDVEMTTVSGTLSINTMTPPQDEFDDGVVYLGGSDSDDVVMLGNTHDGAYQVNVIPGTYDVYYGLETAGGTVPENKHARLPEGVVVGANTIHDIDVPAVAISGSLTMNDAPPPSSVYEDGRLYLRQQGSDDALLLGSTSAGSYSAVVVPGNYEVFYAQEVGGQVPSNQNAPLGPVSVQAPMTLDLDVAVVDLAGAVLVDGAPAPAVASDGGQIYLRSVGGDSALLGNSFDAGLAAKLVAGTYGVYYRAGASVTMPENDNGRFACVVVD